MRNPTRILFVCTYRGGRSQIANAYAQVYPRELVESDCACFEPRGLSEAFVRLISSLGIEISPQSPASVFSEEIRKAPYDLVISMCANKGTKMFHLFNKNLEQIFRNGPKIAQWEINDFGTFPLSTMEGEESIKQTCATIEENVRALVESIENAPSPAES